MAEHHDGHIRRRVFYSIKQIWYFVFMSVLFERFLSVWQEHYQFAAETTPIHAVVNKSSNSSFEDDNKNKNESHTVLKNSRNTSFEDDIKNNNTSLNKEQSRWLQFRQEYRRRHDRHAPDTLRQWLAFAIENNCETTRFYDSINHHLEFYRNSSLSLDDIVPGASKYTNFFVAFSLENNTLTVEQYKVPGRRFEAKFNESITRLRFLLRPLVEHKPPIRTKFVMDLDDKGKENNIGEFPLFSCNHVFAHPNQDSTFEKPMNWTQALLPSGNARDLLVPYKWSIAPEHKPARQRRSRGRAWKKRDDVIVWRGSTTGQWFSGPRFKLLEQFGGTSVHPIAPNVSVDVDFAFVTPLVHSDGRDLDASKYRVADKITYGDMQKHKYIMDVDGHAFSGRFPSLLDSGSLVFKSTRYQEWFTERVVPWVDYVPVKYDLSDLVEKVEWAHSHPELAARIARHARSTAENNLRREDQQCHTYRLLLEYHDLFD